MSCELIIAIATVLSIGFIVTVMGISIGKSIEENSSEKLKKEAVKLGFAEWVPDDSGKTKFRWKIESENALNVDK